MAQRKPRYVKNLYPHYTRRYHHPYLLDGYLATDKRDEPPKTKKLAVIVLTLLALALLSLYVTAIAEQMTVGKSLAFIALLMLAVIWVIGKIE